MLFTPSVLFSQNNSFFFDYNWDHIGDNTELGFQKKINNHFISGGLLYFLNFTYDKNNHWSFKRQYYASDFKEHLGLDFTYKYFFRINNSDIEPYAFYSIHLFKNRIKYDGILIPYGRINNKPLYYEFNALYKPSFSMQNTIGLGVKFPIYKNIDLFAQAGVGFVRLKYMNNIFDPSVSFTVGAVYNQIKKQWKK